ncbi:YbhB/YbcL family Raf kinase inhibitor-like protein, partial [Propionibacterium freudenreichii]
MRLFSDDLKQGEEIPLVFAEPGAGGRNILPQLGWDEVPAEAKSLALTCWDPDAPLEGGFWHWLALDIPVSTTGTVQGTPLPAGSVELQNDYGYRGYGGPNPP